jgi:hypothetical protein
MLKQQEGLSSMESAYAQQTQATRRAQLHGVSLCSTDSSNKKGSAPWSQLMLKQQEGLSSMESAYAQQTQATRAPEPNLHFTKYPA